MSKPITAGEVVPPVWISHDKQLCHITEAHQTESGGVFLGWTEDIGGKEAYFNGTFMPNAYVGELETP